MRLPDTLKQALTELRQTLDTDIRDLFRAEGRLVDKVFLDELFNTLVRTDMGIDAAREIVADIRDRYQSRVVELKVIADEIKGKIKAMLSAS